MIRTQIYLTEEEHSAIVSIAGRSGKRRSEVIRGALDDFIARQDKAAQLERLRSARGVWADRADVPDVRALRAEFERY